MDGDVDLSRKDLIKIPLKFNKVNGLFSCSNNLLTSLEGCPKEGGGDFFGSRNNLFVIIHYFSSQFSLHDKITI